MLWAGLYWGARTPAAADPAIGVDPALLDRVRLAVPGGALETITASVAVDVLPTNYQGFADVTQQVSDAGAGTYQVANVQAGTGPGTYAGWSLQVVYRDSAQPLCNLTVLDGYAFINASSPVTIEVSGLETPPAGDVQARLGLVTYEGDLGIGSDGVRFGSTTSPSTNTPVGNTLSPATDPWNSSITNLGARVTAKNPDYANQLGIDVDRFDVSGPTYLANGATTAAIYLSTGGDSYLPGVVTLATSVAASDLSVNSPTADPDFVQAGASTTLGFQVTNLGPDTEPAPVLTFDLPTGATLASATASTGTCALAGTRVTCTFAPLAPGSVLAAIELVAGSASGTLTGVATVSGTNRDQDSANNSASIDVEVNRAPVAVADTATTPSGTAATVTVLGNDTDADGDDLVLEQVIDGAGGTASANADGTVTFTPAPTFRGSATFTYTVSDGRGGSATATVTVAVANGGPFAADDEAQTVAGEAVIVDVLANDGDVNGDVLSVAITTAPADGSAVVNADGTVTYTRDPPCAGCAGGR